MIGAPKLHWSIVLVYKFLCIPDMIRDRNLNKRRDLYLEASWRREARKAVENTIKD